MNYFQHQTVNFIEGNPNITEVLSIKKIGQETGLQEPTVVPRLKPCFELPKTLQGIPRTNRKSPKSQWVLYNYTSHYPIIIHYIGYLGCLQHRGTSKGLQPKLHVPGQGAPQSLSQCIFASTTSDGSGLEKPVLSILCQQIYV